MTTIERRQYEMFVRAGDFVRAYLSRFPESSVIKDLLAAIDAAVKALSLHAAAKMSAAQEGKSNKAKARKALRDRLEAIAGTARAIGQDTPGLEDKFQVPDRKTDQALLTAGRVFAQDADGFASQFISHAMPATFIADLNGLVDQFEQAIHDRQAGKDGQVAARASIEAAVASGLVAVRKLDAMVTNHLHDDPVTTAVWRRDRRIDYRSRGRSTGEAPAPEPVPVAAAVTAAPSAAGE